MEFGTVNVRLRLPPVNRLVRSFILADLAFWGGWGLVGPMFALFIIDRIPGATAVTVGVAVGIYWGVRALVQLPVATYIDRHRGERDDFRALVFGLVLGGFSALAYLAVGSAPGLYFVSLLQGAAFGFYSPSWYAIFSRHLDRESSAFDWALDGTGIAIVSGVSAILGAAAVRLFGFESLFGIASALSFVAAFLLVSAPRIIFPEPTGPAPVPGSRPPRPTA